MKWIEPENGGFGAIFDFSHCYQFKIIENNLIRFYFYSPETNVGWIYPDESSRDTDYERIRRIVFGIDNKEVTIK